MCIKKFIVRENVIGYEVDFNQEDIKIALKFAKEIILGDNQFDRFHPSDVKDKTEIDKYRIQRTCVGKLGEIAFYKLLVSKHIYPDVSSMFQIYEGKNVVDNFDFVTSDNKTVDVKTGFLSNHKKLMINLQQLYNLTKDYYVGVKLETNVECSDKKIFEIGSIVSAKIMGYAECDYIKNEFFRCDFGEGMAAYRDYKYLLGIDDLIQKFK